MIQRFADAPAEVCRKCGGGPVERMLSAPAIQFKGTGWYITDYARKGKGEPATVSHGANGNGANGNGSSAKTTETTTPAAGTTEKTGEKKA